MKQILISNPSYPKNLKNIYDPPSSIYVKGEILARDDTALALVGSREGSIYGIEICERLAYGLASRGITVVSGMARGIDSAAHRGAIRAGGRTIAVFGCGLDRIYPPENTFLAEEIEKNGALVSEFPEGTEPFGFNFPRRNRIISGLSLGVVVVEAAKQSGALITAYFALEQGREVFAVPGKVGSSTSVGVHRLIKEGAKLVENVDDIIDELNLKPKAFDVGLSETSSEKVRLDDAESRVYSILSDEPKYIDDITEETKLLPNEISNILLKLQIRKLIKELPGKRFYR